MSSIKHLVLVGLTVLSSLVLSNPILGSIPEDNTVDDMVREHTEKAFISPELINDAVHTMEEVVGLLL
jgi:hypothetical protein